MRKLAFIAALLGGSLLPIATPAVAAVVVTRAHPAYHPRGRYYYRGRYYSHRYYNRGHWYYR